MLSLFANLSTTFNTSRKLDKLHIDNVVAKLHYRFTSVLLLVATILLCAVQYFGDVINCVQSGSSIPNNILNTYCLYYGTFSLKDENSHFPGHPNIGPFVEVGKVNHHVYYQWVPFYVFFLSITFYASHFFWKIKEGGKLKSILAGFELMPYCLLDNSVDGLLTRDEKGEVIDGIAKYLWAAIKHKVNTNWGLCLIFFEITTLLQLLFAYWLTYVFLGDEDKTFLFYENNNNATFTKLFPTLTMCTFRKYGPTGGITTHHSICLLALNNINEKVFWILHYWFPFLLLVTVLALIWRFICLISYKSLIFNRYIFQQKYNIQDMQIILKNINFSDWLLLCYISMNINGFVFQEVYTSLAKNIRNSQAKLIEFNKEKKQMDYSKF